MEAVPKRPADDGPRRQRLQDRGAARARAPRLREQGRQRPHQAAGRPDALTQR